MNQLYYRDNLHVLRENIADQSVALICLTPSSNSKRNQEKDGTTPTMNWSN